MPDPIAPSSGLNSTSKVLAQFDFTPFFVHDTFRRQPLLARSLVFCKCCWMLLSRYKV